MNDKRFFMGWGLGGKGNHQNITEPEGGITTKILPFPTPPSGLILMTSPRCAFISDSDSAVNVKIYLLV